MCVFITHPSRPAHRPSLSPTSSLSPTKASSGITDGQKIVSEALHENQVNEAPVPVYALVSVCERELVVHVWWVVCEVAVHMS